MKSIKIEMANETIVKDTATFAESRLLIFETTVEDTATFAESWSPIFETTVEDTATFAESQTSILPAAHLMNSMSSRV